MTEDIRIRALKVHVLKLRAEDAYYKRLIKWLLEGLRKK